MRLLVLLLTLFVCNVNDIFAQVNPNNHRVNGHYRSNGSYVEPHYRTNPNQTINDNYSTYPNVNPYTGKQGAIQPEYSERSNALPNSYSEPRSNYYNSSPTYSQPRDNYNSTPSSTPRSNYFDNKPPAYLTPRRTYR